MARKPKMAETERAYESDEPGQITGIDLDSMSNEEIMALVVRAINRLQPDQLIQTQNEIIERRRAREQEVKDALMAEFRDRAMSVGIPFETLFTGAKRRARSDAGQPVKVKYRGPLGETWSGRGRPSQWLIQLEATGHSRDEFLVQEESE